MGVEIFYCLHDYLGIERCKKSYLGKPDTTAFVDLNDTQSIVASERHDESSACILMRKYSSISYSDRSKLR